MMKKLFSLILLSLVANGAFAATAVCRPAEGCTGIANNNAATLTRSGNHALTITTSGTATLNIGTGGTLGTAAYTSAGAYEVPLTFSTGLTRTVNTVTVNTAQNIATLSNLTSNGLVTTSGGTGALSVTVPGTGILTALGVNVGSAGAPVVNGGALGTPSSGVATNLTGTAAGLSIGGNAATATLATTATNQSGGTVAATTIAASSTITPSQTNGIVGTTTNNSANAGSVGEYVESVVAIGAAVSLTSGVTKTITSISLTAGDWNVWGIAGTSGNGSTLFQYIIGAISTTDNGISDANRGLTVNSYGATGVALLGGSAPAMAVSPVRILLSVTTTIYIVTNVGFSVSTATAYGSIYARRVR